jgi:hypothetical protein
LLPPTQERQNCAIHGGRILIDLSKRKPMQWLIWAIILLVALAIFAGIITLKVLDAAPA